LLAPSNPITSIGPILAVPGVREALQRTKARIAAVSPIVAGAAVSGPAGILMSAQGLPVSVTGVAEYYRDFLDVLVVDERDAGAGEELRKSGLRVYTAKTLMRTNEDRADLAHSTLLAISGQSAAHAGPNPS
jgi:LPPG:FO 2-phospho-L-lactate transferase